MAMKNGRARGALAIVLVLIAIAFGVYMICSFKTTPDEITLAQYDDYRVLVGQMVHQDFERFFQFSVLILGGVISLGVVKKDDRLTKADWPEIVLLVVSASFLCFAIYSSVAFGNSIERLYWDMHGLVSEHSQIIDFFKSPYYRLEYRAVSQGFYGGLISSAVFVVSLCILRRQ